MVSAPAGIAAGYRRLAEDVLALSGRPHPSFADPVARVPVFGDPDWSELEEEERLVRERREEEEREIREDRDGPDEEVES